MKKHLILLSLLFFSLTSYAQIVFEKGYFIDNSNEMSECLIKNIDWNSNPTSFEYKLNETAEIKNGTLNDVKEFGVYNESKYVRFKGNIDRSSDNEINMSDQQSPIFKEEELFLKVLVEGKADLYGYTDGNLKRFFYSIDDGNVEQLVYKKFKLTPTDDSSENDGKIGINNTYKQQLWNSLKCASITSTKAEKLEYQPSSLSAFFEEYNKCADKDFVNPITTEKRDLFNLNIRPGVNFSSLTMERSGTFSTAQFDFDSQTTFRIGLETELIMGFNKNKWSIIIEPTFQSFSGEAEYEITTLTLDYKSIELPVGLRYYSFLNDKSKLFVNGQFVFDFSLNSTLENNISDDYDVKGGINFAIGLGYKYNDKFSIEGRYLTPRNLLSDYAGTSTDYKTFSIVLGYTLF